MQKEIIHFRVPGQTAQVTQELRAVMVYRLESGAWRISHRQADSQTTKQPVTVDVVQGAAKPPNSFAADGQLLHGLSQAAVDHEHRAALICLATAAGVSVGQYTAVGDEAGGYFCLPPWSLWAEWAGLELDKARHRCRQVSVWINGKKY